jgi:hypothetical protein
LTCFSTAARANSQLLADRAELEARVVHRNMACETLYTDCVYELQDVRSFEPIPFTSSVSSSRLID